MAILFSIEKKVFLIDIATSISEVQQSLSIPYQQTLISSKSPLETPWQSTEPDSEKAKANVRATKIDSDLKWEHEITSVVTEALAAIHQNYKGPWYVSRQLQQSTHPDLTAPLSKIIKYFDNNFGKIFHKATNDLVSTSSSAWLPWLSSSYTNMSSQTKLVSIKFEGIDDESQFYCPPYSSFTLANLPTTLPLPVPLSGFHISILDPPWPNRSARRSSSYKIVRDVSEASELLAQLHLERYISEEISYVAIWVTNKSKVKIAAKNFLQHLGLEIIEEWAWIKVTTKGEPVLSLQSEWRKPYEILYIGKRVKSNEQIFVTHRIIVAVPDEHSRKPCLKKVFEKVLDLPKGYVGLEVFARHLVRDWHSWGNEVLLFNNCYYWTR